MSPFTAHSLIVLGKRSFPKIISGFHFLYTNNTRANENSACALLRFGRCIILHYYNFIEDENVSVTGDGFWE